MHGFSTDGIDFSMWEYQHPRFPIDTEACSHKKKRCSAKYLILLSAAFPKVLQILGPFKGGVGDNSILEQSGILEKLKAAGKVCGVYCGFRMNNKELAETLSFPDYMDSKELHQFKSRIRCRQETFNGRMTFFNSLSQVFEYGYDKHKLVVHAVAATIQYQMDFGSPIFSV